MSDEQIPLYHLLPHCPRDASAELRRQYMLRLEWDSVLAPMFVEPDPVAAAAIKRHEAARITQPVEPAPQPMQPESQPVPDVINDDTLESVKRAHIQRVISTSRTLLEAANRLGMRPAGFYKMRSRMLKGAATTALLFLCAVCTAQPLFPAASAPDEPAAPVTYPRTVTWSAVADADSYTLTVNGTWQARTSETAVTNVPLVAGTNLLAVVSHRGEQSSADAAVTNYLITLLTITDCHVVSAPDPRGPWTVTKLPGPQTNWTGGAVYFKLEPTKVDVLDEQHI